jgi:hypothetical protein
MMGLSRRTRNPLNGMRLVPEGRPRCFSLFFPEFTAAKGWFCAEILDSRGSQCRNNSKIARGYSLFPAVFVRSSQNSTAANRNPACGCNLHDKMILSI